MKTNQTKKDKLLYLFKEAVRSVIKEELSGIIKTVMVETSTVVNSKRIPEMKNPAAAEISEYTKKRVFTESDSYSTPEIISAANKIRENKFNINDLKNIVSEETIADPLAGISDSDVDAFINKTFGN